MTAISLSQHIRGGEWCPRALGCVMAIRLVEEGRLLRRWKDLGLLLLLLIVPFGCAIR